MQRILTALYTVLALWFTATVLNSCTLHQGESSAFEVIESGSWAYGDTLWFDLTVDTTITNGRLEVALRHTNDYPYSNIWLEVTSHDKAGLSHTDTVNIELCDVFGRWYGNGFGDSYQITEVITPSTTLDTLTRIGLRHIMRVDTLRGIDQAGVRYFSNAQ